MELIIAICLVAGVLVCIVVPVASYVGAYERAKGLWPKTFVRTYRIGEGAYRSMLVREERSIHAPPVNVDVVAAISAFLGMMWLPALPFVLVGLLCEADRGVGPALVFGLPGLALSLAIFCTGTGLLERKRARAARLVAWWSLAHNAAVLVAIAYTTRVLAFDRPDPLRITQMPSWRMYSLDNGVAAFALLYVLVSIWHGVAMLRAAALVSLPLRAPPAPAPACSSPSSRSSSAPPS